MALTKNLRLPKMSESQRQKHVTHNEALDVLDVICQLSVVDKDLAIPPVRPPDGSRYIVAPPGAGAWLGKSGKVAAWVDGAWEFFDPQKGWVCWVRDEGKLYVFDGAGWFNYDRFVRFLSSNNLVNGSVPQLGVSRASSTTNRLTVSSPAVLFDNSSDHMRAVVNKRSAVSEVSVSFQNGYSTRAVTGLVGSDDFLFRSSADGTSWFTGTRSHGALSGRTILKQGHRRHETSLSFLQASSPTGLIYQPIGERHFISLESNSFSAWLGNNQPALGIQTGSGAITGGRTASIYGQTPHLWRGNSPGLGGFYVEMRFTFYSTESPAYAGFVGLTANPRLDHRTPVANSIGLNWRSNSPTEAPWVGSYGPSLNSYIGFPCNPVTEFGVTNTSYVYELILSAEPNAAEISFQLQNLTTGFTISSYFEGSAGQVYLPANNVFMTPIFWCNNGFDARPSGLVVISCYTQNTSLLGSRGSIDR